MREEWGAMITSVGIFIFGESAWGTITGYGLGATVFSVGVLLVIALMFIVGFYVLGWLGGAGKSDSEAGTDASYDRIEQPAQVRNRNGLLEDTQLTKHIKSITQPRH